MKIISHHATWSNLKTNRTRCEFKKRAMRTLSDTCNLAATFEIRQDIGKFDLVETWHTIGTGLVRAVKSQAWESGKSGITRCYSSLRWKNYGRSPPVTSPWHRHRTPQRTPRPTCPSNSTTESVIRKWADFNKLPTNCCWSWKPAGPILDHAKIELQPPTRSSGTDTHCLDLLIKLSRSLQNRTAATWSFDLGIFNTCSNTIVWISFNVPIWVIFCEVVVKFHAFLHKQNPVRIVISETTQTVQTAQQSFLSLFLRIERWSEQRQSSHRTRTFHNSASWTITCSFSLQIEAKSKLSDRFCR